MERQLAGDESSKGAQYRLTRRTAICGRRRLQTCPVTDGGSGSAGQPIRQRPVIYIVADDTAEAGGTASRNSAHHSGHNADKSHLHNSQFQRRLEVVAEGAFPVVWER